MRGRLFLHKVLRFLAGSLLFVAGASALEIAFMRIELATFWANLLFLLLLNLNILALVCLVYYVTKRLHRLVMERRRGVLGHKFRTRVVAFFVVLVAIPSALLFIISSELGTNYIDRFFTPQFRRPIESALAVAAGVYEMERQRTLRHAEMARAGLSLPPDFRLLFFDTLPEDASASVAAAFDGQHETEVISTSEGDIVRAALPLGPDDLRGNVLVVETALPQAITQSIEQIQTAYEDYIHLEAWKGPIKLNYLLLLSFFTLIIIFSTIWVALRIAGWITEPVRSLAYATEEVARGNLDVNVISTRRDEMGLLIESFNRMVREMKRDKGSLTQAYQHLENIVKNIQSGVITLDRNGSVHDINQAACRFLNIRAEDARGRDYRALLAALESEELEAIIRGINLRTFRELDREVRATVEGRKVLVRLSITSLRGLGGEHLGLLVVLDDLTDVAKAQRALAWQEVARRIAHEIKNPLTPIRLSTERMLKKWQSGDPGFGDIFERSTGTIIREVDALRRMVDEFSRLGKMPDLMRAPTDVAQMVEEVVTLYRDMKGLEIEVQAPTALPPVALDREQFKRVLINLFDNAIEAMHKQGRIGVDIASDAGTGRFHIIITDDGPGIPEDVKEKLFVPYFSTRKNGTGLGLAIADRIVAEHGGSIRVRDNEPRGSVFTIDLPVGEEV